MVSLLRSIALSRTIDNTGRFPSARILLIDIHGEYGRALHSIASVFRVNPSADEKPLHIPFWALDPVDLLTFLMGKLDDKPLSQVLDRIYSYKTKRVIDTSVTGIDLSSMTADSPIPFSLKKLWFELLEPEIKTWEDQPRNSASLG